MPASSTWTNLAEVAAAVAVCRRCHAAGFLSSGTPRLLSLGRVAGVNSGAGWPRIMVVGQAPSRVERTPATQVDAPYVRAIARWFDQAGFRAQDPFTIAHFSAVTRCFPGPSRSGKGDRPPSRAEQVLCADYLAAELALLQPRVVLAVGKLSIDALFGQARPLSSVVGQPWERDGRRFLPLPHPSGASRWHNDAANRALVGQALRWLAAWRDELDLDPGTLSNTRDAATIRASTASSDRTTSGSHDSFVVDNLEEQACVD